MLTIIGVPFTEELPFVPAESASTSVLPEHRRVSVIAGGAIEVEFEPKRRDRKWYCGGLLYTYPIPRDRTRARMPSSASKNTRIQYLSTRDITI